MRALTTICFLICMNSLFGQSGGLKGNVTDNDHQKFGGLKIEIVSGDSVVNWTMTNLNGDYELNNTKPGLYDLRIRHLGFRERILKDVTIVRDETRLFDIIYPGPCFKSERICPRQHADSLIPVVYGLPGRKLMREASKGRVRLGGCIVTGCDPEWYCKVHDIEF
jgi:hypothetical protein